MNPASRGFELPAGPLANRSRKKRCYWNLRFPIGRSARQGVRDIYDLGERLLLVSTDRISAFDWILPSGIPDKGRVLTQLDAFWFERLGEPHHLLSTSLKDLDLPAGRDRSAL